MAENYVVLLRGINTGGLSLKMADLQRLAAELGYINAMTILASGNLLIKSDNSKTNIQDEISAALTTFMSKPIDCLVRTQTELHALLDESDFEALDYTHYILFCDQPLYEQLYPRFLDSEHDDKDNLFGKTNDLHWIVKKGNTLSEFGSKTLGNKKYKSILTSRNLNTIKKILAGFDKL